jgi:hypothetical protein
LIRRTLLRVPDQPQFRLTGHASAFLAVQPCQDRNVPPLGRAADVRTDDWAGPSVVPNKSQDRVATYIQAQHGSSGDQTKLSYLRPNVFKASNEIFVPFLDRYLAAFPIRYMVRQKAELKKFIGRGFSPVGEPKGCLPQ